MDDLNQLRYQARMRRVLDYVDEHLDLHSHVEDAILHDFLAILAAEMPVLGRRVM